MSDLYTQLEGGAVAVASTRRLCRYLFDNYAARMLARGEDVWTTPVILTWDDWVRDEWKRVSLGGEGGAYHHVLDDQQELYLWDKVISAFVESGAEMGLVKSSATSRAARDTWRLMHDWCVPLHRLRDTLIEDTRVYYEWLKDFVREKDRQGWLSQSELCSILSEDLSRGKWVPHRPLLFVGFREWVPAQARLVERMESAGFDLDKVEPDPHKGSAVIVPCLDRRSEFVAAASWARRLLLPAENKSVGVIVDDLALWRDEVELVFDRVLHGGDSLSQDTDRRLAFHISMGKPLAQYPIIGSALMLLGCMKPVLTVSRISHLLHSPFTTGGLSELPARASIDRNLRRLGWEEISLSSLERQAHATGAGALAGCLQAAAGCTWPPIQSPSAWGATFVEWLTSFGWPGERSLSSHEYQAVQAWRELISRFARLNVVIGELNVDQAIAKLEQMAAERVFQPRSSAVPVQVLGVLESSGMQFDHLWITGMSDEDWPPPLRPNPFLPYEVQREYGLPGSVAERELNRYRGITDHLLGAADDIVVSYPRQRDEQVLNLSPVYRSLPQADQAAVQDTILVRLPKEAPALEAISDDNGPALGQEALHGGARIFSDQAACPFRGFAVHRLDATGIRDAVPGLDPMQRGNLAHVCLAGVWGEIKTQETLKALSAPGLLEILQRHIDKAVSDQLAQDSSRFRRSVLEIERRRMVALLQEWMAVERRRPGFSVEKIEHRVDTVLSGIPLRLRIDRVDQVNGRYPVIIDYKTGASIRVEHWLEDRPDDPQLPLYLVTFPDEAGGLAFAQVRKGESTFKGLSRSTGVAEGIDARDDWPELRAQWRRRLEGLGEEFRCGVAVVHPKTPAVCNHCDIKPLCRIFEISRGFTD